MDDMTMAISISAMAVLLVFPLGRRIVKVIFAAALGLLFLLLLSEPRLD